MPVSSNLDIEQGKHLLGADDETRTRRPEELGTDGSPPTCSRYNEIPHNHPIRPGLESPAVTSSPEVDLKKELNNRLLSALYNHSVDNDYVQKLLDEGADPNATCSDHGGDGYACYIAGMFDKKSLAFTKMGGEPGDVSENWTPLHISAYLLNLETVRLLIANDADPNKCDDRGRTPLDVTGLVINIPTKKTRTNFTEVLQALIDAGGKHNTMIEDLKEKRQTPLHTAVELENLDAVKLLLSYGAATGCWNQYGDTPLHVCAGKRNNDIWTVLLADKPDKVDSKGRTPLQVAIQYGWLQGAHQALNSHADVTLQAHDGKTTLHIMAEDIAGCFDNKRDYYDEEEKIFVQRVIYKIISVAKENNAIDCFDENEITALFLAVQHGRDVIVDKLLKEGASIKHTVNNSNVFHVAAKQGHESVLKILLDFDKGATKLMINSLCNQGYGPIHFAVEGNHWGCVNVLDQYDITDLCLKTGVNNENCEIPYPKDTTPLHMAATNDNLDIARTIMRRYYYDNKIPLQERNGNGWCPLHSAISKSNKNFIKYLVLERSDSLIAATHSEKPETALDMILQHVANPTAFLRDLLDSCILYDDKKIVEISYLVLMPNSSDDTPNQYRKEEMDVIEELLNTGDEFNQKGLLLHPLIESFIYLKWQTMKPYYMLIASVYTVFLVSLLIYQESVFNDTDVSKTKPNLSLLVGGGFIIYFLTMLVILQELLMNYEGKHYFRKWRTVLKLGSLLSALIVPPAMAKSETAVWPRHVSSVALFLVCYQMMNLLSQFPSWGYYVVMFKNVAFTFVKILASFSILLVCFAFSFKIQFRSKYPFDGPWHSIVKTLFMLTGEFEYNNVFDPKVAADLGSSFEVVRFILVAFLVLAVIVLMNVMLGVAVDDINELKLHGKIGRLEKQAHFVRSLDRFNYNIWKPLLRCMPQIYQRRKFPFQINILPGDVLKQCPDFGYNIKGLPKRIKDDFNSIAKKNDEKNDSETNKCVQIRNETDKKKISDDTVKRLDALEASIKEMKGDLNSKVDLLIRQLERKVRPRLDFHSRSRPRRRQNFARDRESANCVKN